MVDGDTINVDQTRLRLLSMDAFEIDQTCTRGNREYRCGEESTRTLIKLIGQRQVHCEGGQLDRYKRPLVRCTVSGVDLGQEMVRLGWALAEYGTEYRADEESARAGHLGAWAGTFQRAKAWRAQKRSEYNPK